MGRPVLPVPALLDGAVDVFALETRVFGAVDPDQPDPLHWLDDGSSSPESDVAEPAPFIIARRA